MLKLALIFAVLPSLLLSCACSKHNVQMTPQQTPPSDYLVHARDATGIGDGLLKLASVHWDYIDRFAPQLIARGPLLSQNGQNHAGSIHIIRSESISAAHRFANEEPYSQAGFYSSITVTPFMNLLGRTMWEHAPTTPPESSTFLLASWPKRSLTFVQIELLRAKALTNAHWVFIGLMYSAEGEYIGITAAADLKPETAESALRDMLRSCEVQPISIETSRWRRGGRSK